MNSLSKITMLGVASTMAMSAPTPAIAGDAPWIGEMIVVPYNFCPRGWAEANGALLPVASNSSLFSLIGSIYGGDGRTTMALPDLRGRSVIGVGTGAGLDEVRLGQRGGSYQIQLSIMNMPAHNHTGQIRSENTANADSGNPAGNALGRSSALIYSDNSAPVAAGALHSGTLSINMTGGSLPVYSRNPFLGMRNCISLTGTYPSRS